MLTGGAAVGAVVAAEETQWKQYCHIICEHSKYSTVNQNLILIIAQ